MLLRSYQQARPLEDLELRVYRRLPGLTPERLDKLHDANHPARIGNSGTHLDSVLRPAEERPGHRARRREVERAVSLWTYDGRTKNHGR